MQWRTVILDPDNWAIGEHQIKDVMIWAIQDRPWYNIRTYNIEEKFKYPAQLKTNSWTNVEVTKNNAPESVIREAYIINARIRMFTELYYRLQISAENLGLSNANWNLLSLHEYLISVGVIKGTCAPDAQVQYENKMRLMQDLGDIKDKTIAMVLEAKSVEEFNQAKTYMERRFLTNILL